MPFARSYKARQAILMVKLTFGDGRGFKIMLSFKHLSFLILKILFLIQILVFFKNHKLE